MLNPNPLYLHFFLNIYPCLPNLSIYYLPNLFIYYLLNLSIYYLLNLSLYYILLYLFFYPTTNII